MDLIILNDGLYQLIPVTKQMLEGVELIDKISCLDLFHNNNKIIFL